MHKAKKPLKRKFRLLLDSAFAKPEQFPKLKKKANIAHPVHDFGISPQTEDKDLYQLACLESRIMVTINFRDFRKLVKANLPGIISIPSYLSNNQIDDLLSNFISGKDPEELNGKIAKLQLSQ